LLLLLLLLYDSREVLCFMHKVFSHPDSNAQTADGCPVRSISG